MKRNPLLSENMWKDASGIIFLMLKIKRKPYPAEELMWLSLRNNQLDGYKFRRQHPLKYVADFTVTN
jgi:very-short-patch-repair endonuclease